MDILFFAMILFDTPITPAKDILHNIEIMNIKTSDILESFFVETIFFSLRTIILEPNIPNIIPIAYLE